MSDVLRIATSSPEPIVPASPAEKAKAAQRAAEQRQAKIDLWLLFHEWSEIAKAVITRRDHLILLGLAKRKQKKPRGGGGGGDAGGGGK
jgi:hypothetical protein